MPQELYQRYRLVLHTTTVITITIVKYALYYQCHHSGICSHTTKVMVST